MGAALQAMPEAERTAQLRACGVSPADLLRRLDAIPVWLKTDAAMEVLADWRRRVRRLGDAPQPGDPRWRGKAAALLAEGRALPETWKTAGLPAGDIAGAGESVDADTGRLDAALLGDSLKAFGRRTHALTRQLRDGTVHLLDSHHMAPLREVLGQLEGASRLSPEIAADVRLWRRMIDDWDAERRQAAEIVTQALDLEPRLTDTRLLPDTWRRSARALLDSRSPLPDDAHVLAAGASPRRLGDIMAALPGRLAADDAAREDALLAYHLIQVRAAMQQLEQTPFDYAGSTPWDAGTPLLRGDRLVWLDDEGRHDMIVEVVNHFSRPDTLDHLRLRSVDGTETRNLHALGPLAGNISCRRFLWPDEEVRQRECRRQYPAADAAFPLACEEAVVPGDRIRWTLVRHPDSGLAPLEGDTPLIEAVVEAVDPGVNDVVGDHATLRVLRSWGMESSVQAGATIRQDVKSLFMRGCVRAPWEDETERAHRMAEMLREFETRRRGRSRGLSM